MARGRWADLDELVAEIWDRRTSDDGLVDQSEVAYEATEAIRTRPDILNIEQTAWDAVRRQHEARLPRIHGGAQQMTMFDADAYLPLGEGLSVRMARATEQHFDAWWSVQEAQIQAQRDAHTAKRQYYRTRKAAWRPGELLGTVEARF